MHCTPPDPCGINNRYGSFCQYNLPMDQAAYHLAPPHCIDSCSMGEVKWPVFGILCDAALTAWLVIIKSPALL